MVIWSNGGRGTALTTPINSNRTDAEFPLHPGLIDTLRVTATLSMLGRNVTVVVPSLLLLMQYSCPGGHSRMMALSVYVVWIITSDISVMLPTRLQCVVRVCVWCVHVLHGAHIVCHGVCVCVLVCVCVCWFVCVCVFKNSM